MRTEYREIKRIWNPTYSELGATYNDLKPTEYLEIIYRIPWPIMGVYVGYSDRRCKFLLRPGLSFEVEMENPYILPGEDPKAIKVIFHDNDDKILELKISQITAINILEEEDL